MGQTGIKVPKGSEVYDNLLFTLKSQQKRRSQIKYHVFLACSLVSTILPTGIQAQKSTNRTQLLLRTFLHS